MSARRLSRRRTVPSEPGPSGAAGWATTPRPYGRTARPRQGRRVAAGSRTVLLDAALLSTGIDDVPATARELEDRGYAGVWSSEADHDPFLPLLSAAQATTRLHVGTAIAVAFARSPMTLAMTAHDLQRYSHGRFVLGLGTQIRPHIERRFSMPWSSPVARMREYVAALRAIWDAWQNGGAAGGRGGGQTAYREVTAL